MVTEKNRALYEEAKRYMPAVPVPAAVPTAFSGCRFIWIMRPAASCTVWTGTRTSTITAVPAPLCTGMVILG